VTISTPTSISSLSAGSLTTSGNVTIGTTASPANLTVSGTVSIAGNAAWHAGNDGTGSGLDADLVDGKHYTDITAAATAALATHTANKIAHRRNYNFCIFDGASSVTGATYSNHTEYDLNYECPITTTGGDVRVEYCMGWNLSGGARGGTYMRLWLDNAQVVDSPGYWQYDEPNDTQHNNNCGFWVLTGLLATTHTVEIRTYLHGCNAASCTYSFGRAKIYVEEM
jgi:hypothetical protein